MLSQVRNYGRVQNIGAVAEWLRSGLQSREHRFDSGPRLQFDRE